LAVGSSAGAALPDDDLGRALTALAGRVQVVDTSAAAKWQRAGAAIVDVSYIGSGLVTTLLFPAFMFKGAALETSVRHAVMGAVGTTSLLLVGLTVQGLGWAVDTLSGPPSAQWASEYQGREGMNEFFQLALPDQYQVASTDPELSDFILKLNDAYARINGGFPNRPMVQPRR
jgi:hypothetical protein